MAVLPLQGPCFWQDWLVLESLEPVVWEASIEEVNLLWTFLLI